MVIRALASLLLVACNPSPPEGVFACASDGDCPPGMECEGDRCRTPRVALDAGRDDDAGAQCASECDDGVFCNGLEVCLDGGCVGGPAPCSGLCDEETNACVECLDDDGDGHYAVECGGDDCDDADAARYPGNVEECDPGEDRDEDCDASTFGSTDLDGDDYVDHRCCNEDAAGGRICGDDCDDAQATRNPEEREVCDGVDDDCDDDIDEGVSTLVYTDVDRDGYGAGAAMPICGSTVGFVTNGDDCDDTDAAVHPTSTEFCDGEDNDCDMVTDEGVGIAYFRDEDGDGYGAGGAAFFCEAPGAGWSSLDSDCDDACARCRPEFPRELCGDGRDNDCDGTTDSACGCDWFTIPPREYALCGTDESWTAARTICLSLGGDLVSLESAFESMMVEAVTTDEVWTGGTDMDAEMVWRWAATGMAFVYTNWESDEPNGLDGADCMTMRQPDGEWGDRPCNERHPFVCELTSP